MLRGDQHGVDAKRDHGTVVVLIFDGDLRLTIWQHPRAGALSDDGQSVTQSVRQYQSQRHQGFVFVGGVTKHDTLVTGTDVFQLLDDAVDALKSAIVSNLTKLHTCYRSSRLLRS